MTTRLLRTAETQTDFKATTQKLVLNSKRILPWIFMWACTCKFDHSPVEPAKVIAVEFVKISFNLVVIFYILILITEGEPSHFILIQNSQFCGTDQTFQTLLTFVVNKQCNRHWFEQYNSVYFSVRFCFWSAWEPSTEPLMCSKMYYIIFQWLFSVNRGIPPWDSANTLYIMREEVQGKPAAVLRLCCTIYVHIFTSSHYLKTNEQIWFSPRAIVFLSVAR